MFRHLLVPLDGSHLAEASLSPARSLAASLRAEITLIHVLERNAPTVVHGDRHLASVSDAEQYLRTQAELLRHDGYDVHYHAHDTAEGNVARSICEHAREVGADLIVLTTHGGSGGLRGIVVGSIAQQVIGADSVPVLIIHPEAAPAQFACKRLVVPLDDTVSHETSVPIAKDLAKAVGASVQLVSVVPRRGDLAGGRGAVGRLLPTAMAALLDEQERIMGSRLHGLCESLQAEGVPVVSAVVRGEPIHQILKALQQADADLLVLSTHSKRGWAAFWAGSVAPRLVTQWRRPTLLVRASAE